MELMFILSAPLIDRLHQSRMHLVLPHLYNTIPDYMSKYRKLSREGDFLMQDNSLFELKRVVAGDLIDFARGIEAHEIVVPEVLRDSHASIAAAEEFFGSKAYANHRGKFTFAAVVQGKSYQEVRKHYEYLKQNDRIDTICIPFNFEFDAYDDHDEEKKQSGWNRFSLISRLAEEGVWTIDKKHHLLGLYNPAELSVYAKKVPMAYTNTTMRTSLFLSSLRSNDSSSCFWHSLYGVVYSMTAGLLYRKIETHVDFNQTYRHREQFVTFNVNAQCLRLFASGRGGDALAIQYDDYIAEAAKERLK